MTDSTKQLFNAPWQMQYDGEGEDLWITDSNGETIVDFPDRPGLHEQAKRIERLPELYEALMMAVKRCCSSADFGCPKQGVMWTRCKKCSVLPWIELLQKVKEGK